MTIAEQRLRRQLITTAGLRRASDVVAWFGAVQAQEYEPAKWALGLRLKDGAVDARVERAFTQGLILRTHVMRPTWHFVAASDIRWLQDLTGARVQRAMGTYRRKLALDDRTVTRSVAVIERALGEGRHLTRQELGDVLKRARLPLTRLQLMHAALYAELEGIICSGPRRGKQFTYALVAERAPNAPRLSGEEALATLSRRFFRSHGPATIRDFVWWSGLPTADARRAVDMIKATREEIGGYTYWTVGQPPRGARRPHPAHLLPIYDEYLVAYRDRDAVPHALGSSGPSFVTFQHALVIGGQVAGTWRVSRTGSGLRLTIVPFRRLTSRERAALTASVQRYTRFVSVPVAWSMRLGSV